MFYSDWGESSRSARDTQEEEDRDEDFSIIDINKTFFNLRCVSIGEERERYRFYRSIKDLSASYVR